MASNQNPKPRKTQSSESVSQSQPVKRRKKKMIKSAFSYGDNKFAFDLEPKYLVAIISTLVTLLGLSTNLVLQARNQTLVLPPQRVAEDSR